jgi:hypothetical protein
MPESEGGLTRTRGDVVRCPACGGLNPPRADWCGQCLRRFAPEPEPDAEPAGDSPAAEAVRPAAAISEMDPLMAPTLKPSAHANHEVRRGAFLIGGGVIAWSCARCGTPNDLEARSCSACDAPFASTVSPPAERSQRDPNSVALYSLLVPGAGYAHLRLWGQAIARASMSTWVVSVAVFAVISRSLVLAAAFGAAALALWVVGAHDAYWAAKNDDRRAILSGRRWLYLTVGLVAILFLVLILGAAGVSRGA